MKTGGATRAGTIGGKNTLKDIREDSESVNTDVRAGSDSGDDELGRTDDIIDLD
jgi:hypothetical protein